MLRTWLAGGLLIVTAVVVLIVGDVLQLELEGVVLFGVAVGAIVALVPDRSAAGRLAGFAAGFLAAWVGYVVRAGVFPDSLGGRITSVILILGICVIVAGAAHRFVPLWATLLGAVAVVGAYEQLYSAAPAEVLSTSTSTVTALLMTTSVGFLVAALVTPASPDQPRAAHADATRADDGDDETHPLNDLMEKSK